MDDVLTIYEAKTNLSKYIKQAKAGKPAYIGNYGRVEVVLTAVDQDLVGHTKNQQDINLFLKQRFADGGAVTSITSPSEWQQQVRTDRLVAGRG